MAVGAVGLVTVAATSASAATITETFGGHAVTGPLEIQLSETITPSATSVIQGNNITFTVPGSTQQVPASQSGVPVNYISGLTTIIPVPANTTFVSLTSPGSWSFTDANNVTTTGAMSLTECSATTTACTATMTPTTTFLGPTASTTGTTFPYIESSTGSATFTAGGTLTLPSYSFTVDATGSGTIQTTVSEFDTNANVNLGTISAPQDVNIAVAGYPAAYEAGCFATPTSCTTQPAYQFQPITATPINSPPAAPVLTAQTGNVSAGQCTTINPLTGATDTGTGDSANPATVAVVARTDAATVTSGSALVTDASILATDQGAAVHGTGIPNNTYVGTVTAGTGFSLSSSQTSQVDVPATANGTSVTIGGPLYGTASVDTTTGIITYCNTGGTAASDTFQVTAADTLAQPPLTSAPVTETINISYNQCSAGSGNVSGGSTGTIALPTSTSAGGTNGTGCSLHQAIILPVTSGQIILSQANGLPSDFLGSSLCAGTPTPGITLNGNEQAACGVVSPLTITNATGLDTGWTVTGQVSDFNDPAQPTLTCDTVATYSNHCIPGGNLAWEPSSAVASSIVPGDTAQVTSGGTILPFTPQSPTLNADPLLPGAAVQANPVVEPKPNAGLQAAPQTMCSTAAGQSGGTFVCGAGLELLVPASVAEPTVGAYGMPAYTATLTVTLS